MHVALRVIVNCGPCEHFIHECLDSLRNQTYTNWTAVVTSDPCGDDTYTQAIQAASGDNRISVTRNETRMYGMANLVSAMQRSRAEPDDVIVCLDGDDWLYTSESLAIIAHTVKGKGVSFMEDDNNWHYRIPNEAEVNAAKAELGLI